MNLIVAADKNWAIGYGQDLLVRIPEDMKMFREMTMGNVIVMGRKTLESFPGGKPLKGRVNIVLTGQKDYDGRGAVVVHNEEELREELKKYDSDRIFVVGGGSIYSMLLPYCRSAYVTRLDYSYQADTWMPDLDRDPDWEMVFQSGEHTCFDLIYYFTRYENRKVKSFS
ncbi:MAG: dihydrofolate reductase [Eubacterium sp.]|nr:dihydrofolate reductase [Eubacterium sp.]